MLDRLPTGAEIGERNCPRSRVEGRVEIDPTARIFDSIISGPVIIGPGALVKNSYIGPYTSVGAGVRILNAEVERSIVLEGTTIEHLASRVERSTGADVN